MAEKTFTIPEDKKEKAIINGILTDDIDYIIWSLAEVVEEYLKLKKDPKDSTK